MPRAGQWRSAWAWRCPQVRAKRSRGGGHRRIGARRRIGEEADDGAGVPGVIAGGARAVAAIVAGGNRAYGRPFLSVVPGLRKQARSRHVSVRSRTSRQRTHASSTKCVLSSIQHCLQPPGSSSRPWAWIRFFDLFSKLPRDTLISVMTPLDDL